jgi:hypothetical protein
MLKTTLTANAVFSAISGSSILLYQNWLMMQIPAPVWFWLTIGTGLILFSAQLFLIASMPELAKKLTLLVVYSDIGWVILSLLGWVLFLPLISFVGSVLILAVNIAVGTLAILQFRAFQHSYKRMALM